MGRELDGAPPPIRILMSVMEGRGGYVTYVTVSGALQIIRLTSQMSGAIKQIAISAQRELSAYRTFQRVCRVLPSAT